MPNVFARFFLVIYLFSALTPVQVQEELGKLPQLTAHFQLHKIENPAITFIEFWAEHYGEGFKTHKTAHDHSDLPGKDNNHQHSFSCANHMAALPNEITVIFEPMAVLEAVRVFSPKTELLVSQHLSCIWQPPKSC